jgi:hypothetical protein
MWVVACPREADIFLLINDRMSAHADHYVSEDLGAALLHETDNQAFSVKYFIAIA